jgi:hypothetical protein
VHIRQHTSDPDTLLSAYFDETCEREDLRDSDVRSSLKTAAAVLDYPRGWGIPIKRIVTLYYWHGCTCVRTRTTMSQMSPYNGLSLDKIVEKKANSWRIGEPNHEELGNRTNAHMITTKLISQLSNASRDTTSRQAHTNSSSMRKLSFIKA